MTNLNLNLTETDLTTNIEETKDKIIKLELQLLELIADCNVTIELLDDIKNIQEENKMEKNNNSYKGTDY